MNAFSTFCRFLLAVGLAVGGECSAYFLVVLVKMGWDVSGA